MRNSRKWEGSKDRVSEGNNWQGDGAHEAGHDYSESEENGTEYRYGVGHTVDDDLFVATVTGNSEALGVAVEAGANVNGVDARYGWPYLYWAAQKRMSVSVLMLLDGGADPNRRGFNGEAPLHAAARWADLGSIVLLLPFGAGVNARDNKNRTPLFHAAHYGRFLAAYLLLARGADATIAGTGKRPGIPLLTATKRGHREIAGLLAGERVSEKNVAMMKRYGLSGEMAQDVRNWPSLMKKHVVDYGPKPLRAGDVRDQVMEIAIWQEKEKAKPREERYGFIVRRGVE